MPSSGGFVNYAYQTPSTGLLCYLHCIFDIDDDGFGGFRLFLIGVSGKRS